MKKLTTRNYTAQIRHNMVNWLFKGAGDTRRYELFRRWLPNHIQLTSWTVRQVQDEVLRAMTNVEDSSYEWGCFQVQKPARGTYVRITLNKKRLPISHQAVKNWSEWDRPGGWDGIKITDRLYTLKNYWFPGAIAIERQKLVYSLVADAFIHAMFNPLAEVDLDTKELPKEDLICHVGGYRLLYDHLDKEWRVWKPKTTKI